MGRNLKSIKRVMYERDEIGRNRYFRGSITIQGFRTDIDDVVYQGCPSDDCFKKVQPSRRGHKFWCPKCERYYRDFEYRFKLKVIVNDGSMSQKVTMFDNTAPDFLGITASELVEVYDEDEDEYESYFEEMLDKMCDFTIKETLVLYGDNNPRKILIGVVKDFDFDD